MSQRLSLASDAATYFRTTLPPLPAGAGLPNPNSVSAPLSSIAATQLSSAHPHETRSAQSSANMMLTLNARVVPYDPSAMNDFLSVPANRQKVSAYLQGISSFATASISSSSFALSTQGSSSSSAAAASASHLSRKRTAEAADLTSNAERPSKRVQTESSAASNQKVVAKRIIESLAPRIQFAEKALKMLRSQRLISGDALDNLAAKLTASLLIDPPPEKEKENNALERIRTLFQSSQTKLKSSIYTVYKDACLITQGITLRNTLLPNAFVRKKYLKDIAMKYFPQEIAFETAAQSNNILFETLLADMLAKSSEINSLLQRKEDGENESRVRAQQLKASQRKSNSGNPS